MIENGNSNSLEKKPMGVHFSRDSDPDHVFYTVDEVAEMLRVQPQWVRRLIRDKKLKAHRPGKSYYISHTQYEDYLRRAWENEGEDS